MTDGRTGAATALPKEGDVLGGAYRVVQRIGAGGMGAVYEVERLDGSSTRLAMKLMLPHLADDKEFTARFMREARAASVIESEHVAKVSDVGSFDDGSLYMTMQLLRGTDLERELRKRGPLPIDEAVGYMIEVCDAIADAHRRGIIHRDLKPANIFLERRADGTSSSKVLDFGISKATRVDLRSTDIPTLTQTDSTLGSPKYMSPEQLKSSKSADARSDIWSLGVILYRMVSAHFPYEADSLGAYAVTLATDPPTPLHDYLPQAPPDFERVLMRCLEKDAKRRFQTVGQLVGALAPFAPPSSAAIIARIADHDFEAPPESMTIPRVPPSESASDAADATTLATTPTGASKKSSKVPMVLAGVAASGLGGVLAVVAERYWAAPPPTQTSADVASSAAAPTATALEASSSAIVVESRASSAPAADSAAAAPTVAVKASAAPAAVGTSPAAVSAKGAKGVDAPPPQAPSAQKHVPSKGPMEDNL